MENNIEQPIIQPPPARPVNEIPHPKSKFKLILFIVILLIIVGGGAYYLGAKQNKLIVGNQQTSPTIAPPIPTSTPDPTANWKTYKNEKYGFEVKYPNNYAISTQSGSFVAPNIISFKPPAEIMFTVDDNPRNLSLSEWVKSDIVIHDLSIKWQSIIVGSVESLKSPISGNMDGGVGYSALIPQKNKVYSLLFSTKAPGAEAELKVFDQMLSTFKFTDQNQTTDTSTWKTYQNSQYGFEIKYPDNPRWTFRTDEYSIFAEDAQNKSLKKFIVEIINIPNILNLKSEEIMPADYNGTLNIEFVHRSFQKEKDLQEEFWVKSGGSIEGDTFFNGKPAVKFSMPRSYEYLIDVSPGITLSIYILEPGFLGDQSAVKKEYSQILSTFKFTN